MISRKALVALATSLFLTIPLAQALEPVDPQPAVPLTFEDPAYQKVVLMVLLSSTFVNRLSV